MGSSDQTRRMWRQMMMILMLCGGLTLTSATNTGLTIDDLAEVDEIHAVVEVVGSLSDSYVADDVSKERAKRDAGRRTKTTWITATTTIIGLHQLSNVAKSLQQRVN